MPERLFLGRGGGGVPPGSALAQDIRNLADQPPPPPSPEQQTAALQGVQDALQQVPFIGGALVQPVQEATQQLQQTQPAAMEANTQANLDAVYGMPGAGQQVMRLAERMADQAVAGALTKSGQDTMKAMEAIRKRIDTLKKRREAIAKSGTNNTQALGAIDELNSALAQRLSTLQNMAVNVDDED